MEVHTLALLDEAKNWDWPEAHHKLATTSSGTTFSTTIPSLLAAAIEESNELGGSLLYYFWKKLGECDSKLNSNVAALLRDSQNVPPTETTTFLMRGVDRERINLEPLFQMATEIFVHLCVAFMNPAEGKSASGTSRSVDDITEMETDDLLKVVASEEEYEARKQEALKNLALKRDGPKCVTTGKRFKLFNALDNKFCINPILSHVIPNSIHKKPETLKLVSIFAGEKAAKIVIKQLDTIGNTMNLQSDAHTSFVTLDWGIEANTSQDGTVIYTHRIVFSPYDNADRSLPGPGFICLKDGDNIPFGTGPETAKLGRGPLPLLCNLHLAVARVTQRSGVADIILRVMDDADDNDCQHLRLSPEDFGDVLTAKLLLIH